MSSSRALSRVNLQRPVSHLHLAGICIYALLLAVVVALLYGLVAEHRERWRGVVLGPPPAIVHASVPAWGTTVALEQYDQVGLDAALAELEMLGMVWLRQRLPWSEIERAPGQLDWERWDRPVAAAAGRGFRLVLVLDSSPAWARRPEDAAQPLAPPADPATFARFAAAVAERYGARVDFYQIWDEPNLRPHWGAVRAVDPAGYAALLRAAAAPIRAADPGAVILTAGLAPTTEVSDDNLSELRFLQALYDAGARVDFDIVALKGFGFWTGPDDRRTDEAVLNWSRLLLARELMVANGDSSRAIWLTGGGWASLPAGWEGAPPPWGRDTPEVQGERLAGAVERAQVEWPWLGAMMLMEFQPAAPRDDPRWSLALRGPDGQLTSLGRRVGELARGWLPGPGHWPADGPGTARDGDQLRFRFVGSEVRFKVENPRTGAAGADRPRLWLDGAPVDQEVRAGGEGWIVLPSRPLGPHELALSPPDAVQAFVVGRSRDAQAGRLYASMVAVLAVLALGLGARLTWLVWRLPWSELRRRWEAVPEARQVVAVAAVVLAFYLVPSAVLSSLLAGLLWLLFLVRLDLGLAAIALVTPFFLQTKPFSGLQFSLVELLTLLCAAAWIWQVGGRVQAALQARRLDRVHATLRAALWPRDTLDWSILFFLSLSAISPLWAPIFGVAAREFRVVVLEPVIFYWLVRRRLAGATDEGADGEWRAELRLVDGLVLGATIVSLYGLYQWLFTDDVIAAEGVRRIRAVYGSPNNLALFLGRVLPLMVAFALPLLDFPTWPSGIPGRRPRLYALALLPVGLALLLTFSRGALLLGVPAALLFLAWRCPGRPRRAILVALILVGLALLPFAATERLRSLADLSAGTWSVRVSLWRSTLDMLRDDFRWLKGVGLDNFLYLYPHYIRPEAWREPNLSHPHNILLHYWVALGLLGGVVLIWQQAAFWRAAGRAWRQRIAATAPLALGLPASMVDYLAHGLIDNSYFLVDLAFVFMLTAALVAGLGTSARAIRQGEEKGGLQRIEKSTRGREEEEGRALI